MSQKNSKLSPIPATKFYSSCSQVREKIKDIEDRSKSYHLINNSSYNLTKERMPQSLLGPTQDWAEFYRQAEALELADAKSTSINILLTFVYEQPNGHRRFIVAHPEVYWWYFNRALPERRCAYEVIPEGNPCCLYLDLEYQNDLNPRKNGPHMTQTLIEIIICYFLKHWGLSITKKNVLNLDSTTQSKFSRHLIFRIKDTAFTDNINAGRFIKSICSDIEEYIATDGVAFHDVLSYFKREDLEELFIETGKRKKLFIDTAVYSRNRHFRIYKATKWGKLSHLVRAKDCKFKPIKENRDKELEIFLESLVTYFTNKSDLHLLEFTDESGPDSIKYDRSTQFKNSSQLTRDQYQSSPYPAIDKFIMGIVKPGTIRVSKYFDDRQKIAYEIIGNRYCANVGRQHKSNNVYWIADLKNKIVYQKCHDQEDCADFKSEPIPFTDELCFMLDEDDDDIFFSIDQYYY
ncbi:DNA-directed primase/polymerase protein isoform X2 [Microplitis demolitor]|uniref:DNA-directed primase/polymerase protein isoform X2 n=1 Tax=Microplitis demolitor TaxID=69319 RepID=UPI0004CCA20A|nr:DNA-directed primase/polymerase protein isoform X2 [Microplitis demolitor]